MLVTIAPFWLPFETASPDVAELALEHGTLAGVPAPAYCARQFRPRLPGPTQSGQQLPSHAWQQVGAREPLAGDQAVDHAKRSGRSACHRQRDGPVQLDDRGEGASRPSAS